MSTVTDVIIGTTTTSILTAADWKSYGGPLYLKNESTQIEYITISGADVYDLDPGERIQVLPGQIVTGTAPDGAALLQIVAGVIPSDESSAKGAGATAAAPMYVSAEGVAVMIDRLDRLIIELKINNEYNHRAHAEQVTAEDLGVGLDYLGR